jgi:uncharacterized damage-inducible protein DinB
MSTYGPAQLASGFRTVRTNTIQIAEDIPESRYDFVPAPGTQSVAAILKHIALAPTIQEDMHRHKRVTTLKGYDFPAAIGRLNAEEAKPRSKAEIVALLKSEGDRFAGWLESLTPEFLAETFTDPTGQHERTRFESLLGPKEHEMHHRGQLMLIERLLGIVPHLTRLREERVAQHVKNLS